jgi:Zn finger protein HypA/HybF involved in hydrogenase expression
MFYVKATTRTGEMPIQLTSNNVYTICPVCGKDHIVDLEEIIRNKDKEFSLRKTTVLCPKCSDGSKELIALFKNTAKNQKKQLGKGSKK